MGEEEKKEEKKEEKEEVKKKEEESNEIILKVDMHCQGCAKKVKRSLRGFEGVEEIQVDTKSQRVVVKGTIADPLKILQRIENKSGRHAELISPTLKSLEEAKEAEEKGKEKKQSVKQEEKEVPVVITAVLNVHMHCENCSQEIRRIIEKVKGVESVDPDLKNKQVTVKGTFDPVSLAAYIHRRTGRHAEIVKQEVEKKVENGKEGKDEKEKKGKGGGGEAREEKRDGCGSGSGEKTTEKKSEKKDGAEEGGETKSESKKSEAPVVPKYAIDYVHAPQFFSDENPNACSIM